MTEVSGRMRLLFVADGRSPITLNWLGYLVDAGHEVHLVSSYPCAPDLKLASLHILPVAFGSLAGDSPALPAAGLMSLSAKARRLARGMVPTGFRTRLRQWFGPLSLSKAAAVLGRIQREIQPDLVHAMRIPYEGMLAAMADIPAPLLISVWGNDFTLHAPSTPLTRRYTSLALQRATALHVDCLRDLRLSEEWGYAKGKPSVVLPTSGGVQAQVFYPGNPGDPYTVINPRGFRAYVRNDSFFKSIPLVLSRHPQTKFLCPAMESEVRAVKWLMELQIENSVQLLPRQSRSQMADLFRQSHVVVSPTTHDGTPNTLLEAMACGCFPVAGDLESLREWISPGVNGLLVHPGDARALADAVCQALEDLTLRQRAVEHNTRLIAERAEYRQVMSSAVSFYQNILGK
jgi:glycosyltransferase involved in cell wall biosynthesis